MSIDSDDEPSEKSDEGGEEDPVAVRKQRKAENQRRYYHKFAFLHMCIHHSITN